MQTALSPSVANLRRLLKRAGGLPEPRVKEGRIVNWPPSFQEMLHKSFGEISTSSSKEDLQAMRIEMIEASARWLPWRKVPRQLRVDIARVIADNPHSW